MRRRRLDRLTASRLRPEAVEALHRWADAEAEGDLSGDDTDRMLDAVRRGIAHLMGTRRHEVVLTSGAVESAHSAVAGVVSRRGGGHVVCTAADEAPVLDAARRWADHVTVVATDEHDRIDPAQVRAEIRADTVLVCLPIVSAVSGAVQPVRAVTAACRDRGVLSLVDATTALGRIGVDLSDLGADLAILDGAPLGGGAGVGALHVRRGVRIDPLLPGPEQRLRRGGAVAVGPALALGAAAAAVTGAELLREAARAEELVGRLARRLTGVEGVEVVRPAPDRVAGHLQLAVDDAPRLRDRLLEEGVELGCTAAGSLRCAPDWSCTPDDVDEAARVTRRLVDMGRGRRAC